HRRNASLGYADLALIEHPGLILRARCVMHARHRGCKMRHDARNSGMRIDCDIHPGLEGTRTTLLPYLDDHWKEQVTSRGIDGLDLTSYPPNMPLQAPDLMVEEIERLAGDLRFVAVLLLAQGETLLGGRHFWPVYQAAERHTLPLAIHSGRQYRRAPSSIGWPSYRLEY